MEVPGRRARNARLVDVTQGINFPWHDHEPGRRRQPRQRVRRSRALIFEDDYDSEFYAGRPIPALQGLDQHGLVFCRQLQQGALFPVASRLPGASA